MEGNQEARRALARPGGTRIGRLFDGSVLTWGIGINNGSISGGIGGIS